MNKTPLGGFEREFLLHNSDLRAPRREPDDVWSAINWLIVDWRLILFAPSIVHVNCSRGAGIDIISLCLSIMVTIIGDIVSLQLLVVCTLVKRFSGLTVD